jgi:hypothetical protein
MLRAGSFALADFGSTTNVQVAVLGSAGRCNVAVNRIVVGVVRMSQR